MAKIRNNGHHGHQARPGQSSRTSTASSVTSITSAATTKTSRTSPSQPRLGFALPVYGQIMLVWLLGLRLSAASKAIAKTLLLQPTTRSCGLASGLLHVWGESGNIKGVMKYLTKRGSVLSTAGLRPNHVGLALGLLHCPSTTKSCWSG